MIDLFSFNLTLTPEHYLGPTNIKNICELMIQNFGQELPIAFLGRHFYVAYIVVHDEANKRMGFQSKL